MVAVMSVDEPAQLISVVGASLVVGIEVFAKVMQPVSISKRARAEAKNSFIIRCFVFTTNLANNEEKTTERSRLFLFFEKKCRKEKSHPVLFSKKYLKNIRVSFGDTLFR